MKIVITTIREFPDKMFDFWFFASLIGLPWLDRDTLKKTKDQSFESIEQIVPGVVTKAKTRVVIAEGEIP